MHATSVLSGKAIGHFYRMRLMTCLTGESTWTRCRAGWHVNPCTLSDKGEVTRAAVTRAVSAAISSNSSDVSLLRYLFILVILLGEYEMA